MKRIIIFLVLLIAISQVFSETLDSLEAQRERLYTNYSEINLPGRISTTDNDKKSELILKDIVIVDTKIIRNLSSFESKSKEYEAKIAKLNSEKKSLSDELSSTTDRLKLIYIAAGAMVCLLVISLVLLIGTSMKCRNWKKKAKTLSTSESDRMLIQQLNDSVLAKDREMAEIKATLVTQKTEIVTDDNKVTDLQNQLGETLSKLEATQNKLEQLQNQPPEVLSLPKTQPIPMSNDEIAKFDTNLIKIEKLSRMKELGIVTEEEFNTFRKKFLGEL